MTRCRWLLALCLGLALAPRVAAAGDDDDKSPQVRLVWYTMDAGGGVSSLDGLMIEGTVGQFEAGDPCIDFPVSLFAGYWVPEGLVPSGEDLLAHESIEAAIVPEGVEIRLEHASPTPSTEVILERGETPRGPWSRVPFERRHEGLDLVLIDPGTAGDRASYYRVQLTAPGQEVRTIGPVAISAGAPVAEFALSPIAPNPSRGEAEVSWSLPRDSRVRLSVHDVQGRQVAVLADGDYPAGEHSVKWRSRGGTWSPGMYFLRLQGPAGVLIRRVVLAP